MCLTPQRHSIFCILPPHVLRSIAEKGTPTQRAAAAMTLTTDATFRALRAAPVSVEGRAAVAASMPSAAETTKSAASAARRPARSSPTKSA